VIGPRFQITGPLPRGRAAIEASAGTGKTFTLAALAARYVAEDGVDVGELLVVTFTRAAAAELRERVRSRLTDAAHALRTGDATERDEVTEHLLAEDRELRAARLEAAITDFDAATITTIHGFAQQVLVSLGSAAPGDLDARLVDDSLEMVAQVCSDVLAAAAVVTPDRVDELPKIRTLAKHVRTVLGNPGIAVVPDPAEATANGGRWRELVDHAVDEIHRRRREAGTLAFDDLLTQLRDALGRNTGAATALRDRYRVALIDEFQDTDPVQWEIFDRIFGDDEPRALVLVGDPKQAIYAFRGANVHTYLEATGAAGTERTTLGTNWRSDQALLDGLEPLLEGAAFGDDRIGFVDTVATGDHADRRLLAPTGEPLPAFELRAALGPELERQPNAKAAIVVDDAWRAIRHDLALHVHEMLDAVHLPGSEGVVGRAVRPGDIAVLVRTHVEAGEVQLALRRQGIPAVTHRGASVLQSEAAVQWRWLLAALTRPSDPRRARTAALSWFFGWPASRLDGAGDDALAEVQEQLYRWADLLETQGVVDFWAHVRAESGVTARLLAGYDGDRNLTDLTHLAELLQVSAPGHRPGPVGLIATLALLDDAQQFDPEDELSARRIETDAEAVQIMTIHAAKGLEFPIVLVPTLWRSGPGVDCIYQDPDTGQRTVDITNGAAWPDKAAGTARKALAVEEAVGESLRVLYVALTRAQHRTSVWWSRAGNNEGTALARLLFGRDADGRLDPVLLAGKSVPMPDDALALAQLAPVFADAGDAAALAPIRGRGEQRPPWSPPGAPDSEDAGVLTVATLDRALERPHRRWSFSSISDRAHTPTVDPADDSLGDAGAADEPVVEPGVERAGADEAGTAPGPARPADEPTDLPLGALAGSAYFGSVVHELLEHVDFAAPDLDAELALQIDALRRWYPIDALGDELQAGLRATIETPLGPRFGGRRLRDLGRGDRLDELTFELHLGTGGTRATGRDVGALLTRHLPAGDPLRPWAELVAAGVFEVELSGHLTGSIDAIFRVADARAEPRFVVVDYKTNVLSTPGAPPRSADYHPGRLPAAMAEHHYPLQALLYSVALHRYLRWRLPAYDPAVHLGGVAYLFLRGMAGPGTPCVDGVPHGVFDWSVPPELVADLSDLLDGRLVTA
jgi:exodeoxyribonuclease V beta subunit